MKYAVIAIGYNRPDSMRRLLNGLAEVDYCGDAVDLLVSIDNSGTDSVEEVAKAFEWPYGNKIIRTYPERMGLRKHVLQCGSYLKEYDYDAVAVFEDDVYPSPAFYNYMRQTVPYYQGREEIAGISLYTHLWNVNAQLPFTPAGGASDVFFMKFAQSWGQIWMKESWNRFAAWYEENSNIEIASDDIPPFVAGWPQSSWLKYHIKYCVETNRYFVYPRQSLTTCYTDVGQHNKFHNTIFHVPMDRNVRKEYALEELSEGSVVYDAFFEREYESWKSQGICVDLYGKKNWNGNYQYVLTMEKLPMQAENEYALELKPHEENVIYQVKGEGIYLYRIEEARVRRFRRNYIQHKLRHDYYYRGSLTVRMLLVDLAKLLIGAVRKR